jgi:hypothetical protein
MAPRLVCCACCLQLGQGAAIERFEEKPGGQIRADMSMDWAELMDFNSEAHVSEVRAKGAPSSPAHLPRALGTQPSQVEVSGS